MTDEYIGILHKPTNNKLKELARSMRLTRLEVLELLIEEAYSKLPVMPDLKNIPDEKSTNFSDKKSMISYEVSKSQEFLNKSPVETQIVEPKKEITSVSLSEMTLKERLEYLRMQGGK